MSMRRPEELALVLSIYGRWALGAVALMGPSGVTGAAIAPWPTALRSWLLARRPSRPWPIAQAPARGL